MKLLQKLSTVALLGLSLCEIRPAFAADELRLHAPEKRITPDENTENVSRSLQIVDLLPLVNAVASSIEAVQFPALNVIDLNLSTRWSSAYTNNQWIYVELLSTNAINRVIINWHLAFGSLYDIETSADAITWTRQQRVVSDGGVDVIDFASSVNAKFVRMNGIQAAAFGYSIREIEVRGILTEEDLTPTVDLPQVAAAASSVENNTPHVASRAIDGTLATRWSSDRTDDEWIYVELDQIYPIDEVEITWEEAFAREYTIQVSDDAVTWTTVFTETAGIGGFVTNVVTAGASGAFVRINCILRGTRYGYSIYEIQVRGDILNPSPDEPITIITPITAVASSVETQDPTLVATDAIDGSLSTRWASQRTDDEWIYVQLDQVREISRVVLHWEAAYASVYEIQTSDTATANSWTTQVTVTNGLGGTESIDLPLLTFARFIRVRGILRATRFGFSIYEIEVYVPTFSAPDVVNPVLLDIASVAASSVGPESPSLPASNAVDGSLLTRWASARTNSEFITVGLGSIFTISQVEIAWEAAFGSVYLIQVSDDGITFTTVLTVNNGQGGTELLDLPSGVTGQFVRMFGVQRGTRFGYSIWEINVWGSAI